MICPQHWIYSTVFHCTFHSCLHLKPSGLINVLSSGNSSDVDSVAVADMMVHKSKILFFLWCVTIRFSIYTLSHASNWWSTIKEKIIQSFSITRESTPFKFSVLDWQFTMLMKPYFQREFQKLLLSITLRKMCMWYHLYVNIGRASIVLGSRDNFFLIELHKFIVLCVCFCKLFLMKMGAISRKERHKRPKGFVCTMPYPLKGGFVPLLLFKTNFIGFNFNITAAAFVTHHEVFKKIFFLKPKQERWKDL